MKAVMFKNDHNFKYGLELEVVDVDRREVRLPSGCKWNEREVTLVNSNGLAVNSTPKSQNFLGGEVNTIPTFSISDQVTMAKEVFQSVAGIGGQVNYRCNLQVHVGIEFPLILSSGKVIEELEGLKLIQKAAYENEEKIILLTMGEMQYKKPDDAPSYYWRHTTERKVPDFKHQALMESETLKDFQKAFFLTKTGKYHFSQLHRQHINLHSYFKTQSIEFRHFWGTLDHVKVHNALLFADSFVKAVFGIIDTTLDDLFVCFEMHNFPAYLPFDSKLESSFKATRVIMKH